MLSYEAPMWIGAFAKKYTQNKYKQMQRLINIRIIKGYRTISYEPSCIMTCQAPIALKIEESVLIHKEVRDIRNNEEFPVKKEEEGSQHDGVLVSLLMMMT